MQSIDAEIIKLMRSDSPRQYKLVKFEANSIVMVHKQTNQQFQYFEGKVNKRAPLTINHPTLQRGTFLTTGVIYPLSLTTLGKQLALCSKIVNTFLPVLDCVCAMRQIKQTHGQITAESIVIDGEMNVRLREPLLNVNNNSGRDFRDLAKLMLRCSFKQKDGLENLDYILKKLLNKFSKGYLLGIMVMMTEQEKFYKYLKYLFQNDSTYLHSFDELNTVYRNVILKEDSPKHAFSPLMMKHSYLKMETPKKCIKYVNMEENTQNKKIEQLKKRNFQIKFQEKLENKIQFKTEKKIEKSGKKDLLPKKYIATKITIPKNQIENAVLKSKGQKEEIVLPRRLQSKKKLI